MTSNPDKPEPVTLTPEIVEYINSREDFRGRGGGRTFGRMILAIGTALCCPGVPVVFTDHITIASKSRMATYNAGSIRLYLAEKGIQGISVSVNKDKDVILKYSHPKTPGVIESTQGKK